MCSAKIVFVLFLFPPMLFSQYLRSTLREASFPGDVRKMCFSGNVLFLAGCDPGVQSFTARSTDSGYTWKALTSPFSSADNITALSFPTGKIGFAAGSNGRIYKTVNGGLNWEFCADTVLYKANINDIHFLNPDTGFFCGPVVSGAIIFKTTNGGGNWTPVQTPITNTMNTMLWTDNNTGWAAGANCKILRTTDCGVSWVVNTPAAAALYKLTKAGPAVFYAVGAGTVLKSTNGGVSFYPLSSPTTSALYSCEFLNEDIGFVLGANGAAYKTLDGGNSWTSFDPLTKENIRTSVKALGKVLIGGNFSTVCRYDPASEVWATASNDSRTYHAIHADTISSVVIAGEKGNVHFSDGAGGRWRRAGSVNASLLNDIRKMGQELYVCGSEGSFAYSNNNGTSWHANTVGTAATKNNRMDFTSEHYAYMVSGDGTIYFTTDKGLNWTLKNTIADAALNNIRMTSDTAGYVVGSGRRIYRSTDFGNNWQHIGLAEPAAVLYGLYLLDGNRGFICGENGAVYKTSDGFKSVTLLTDTVLLHGKTLYDVTAFSDSNVWAVGSGGTILHSVSSSRMTLWDSVAVDLFAMTKLSGTSLAVCGANGCVYRIGLNSVPVQLIAFSCNQGEEKLNFSWVTTPGSDIRLFNLEQSMNSREWSIIASLPVSANAGRNEYKCAVYQSVQREWYYRLAMISSDGRIAYSSILQIDISPGGRNELYTNCPNPFNSETRINYTLGSKGRTRLYVYDLLGKEIEKLVDEEQDRGRHSAAWKADGYPSGIYFCELRAGRYRRAIKMLLLR